jgi:hypothetical protein
MGKKKYIKKTEDKFNKQTIEIVNNLANNVTTDVIETALNRVSIAESEHVVDAREAVNKMLRGLSFKSKKQEYLSEATVSESVKSEATVSEATVSEATVSEATVSEATVSESVKSEATVSESVKSEATVSEEILIKEKPEHELVKKNETKDPIESNSYVYNFLSQLQDLLLKVQSNTAPQPKNYALYFIALEDDNMFLHLSYKKSEEQILYQCEQLYEYTKLFKPLRIVHTMENCDLTDADKYVKQFMKMFGEDSTRGGSYTDIILPEWQKKTLDLEFEVASIEKLDEIDAIFGY